MTGLRGCQACGLLDCPHPVVGPPTRRAFGPTLSQALTWASAALERETDDLRGIGSVMARARLVDAALEVRRLRDRGVADPPDEAPEQNACPPADEGC